MKLVLLFFIFCLQAQAGAVSQEISISEKNAPLAKIIKSIRKQSGYAFLYTNELLRKAKPVTLDVKRASLEEVLEKCFAGQPFTYSLIEKTIVIKPREVTLSEKPVAAPITVTGRVTEDSGSTLPGVTVLLKGTTIGTATDTDGKYSLSLPDGTGTLVFSYVGYVTEEAPVNNRSAIDVQLVPDIRALSEVVVVGYGTQRRQDVTGSIASIKAEDIRTEGSNSIQKALQGRLAGVQVESAGGNPGSGVRVLIRGTGSLNNNNPLYIVDGVQVDNINNLNPTDIASMDVLKDASAAAIYGSRAANGVVLITTKSGKKGENRIDFTSYYGVQQLARKLDVLNASQWAGVSNAAYAAANLTPLDIAKNPETLGEGTDWQQEIYRPAPIQNYTLGASGGGDNYTYSLSGGYLDQEGIVKKTGYNRWNLRIKSDFTKGRVKVGESIILSKESWRNMAGGWGGQGGNPVGSALKMIPVFPIYNADAVGGYGGAYGPVVNVASPVAQLNLEIPESNTSTAILNAFAEVSILEGLKYKFNAGYTNTFGSSSTYTFPYEVGTLFVNRDADLSESRSQTNYFLQEHTLGYDRAIGRHYLQTLAGYTYQNTQYRILNGSKSGMPPGIAVLDAGTASTAVGSNAYESALLSYLGRLIYSYNDRYVLTATFRRDGSSRFGKSYKYGNFPSVALAWNASNEPFLQPLQPVVSTLKVRGSYGVLGNQEIADYRYINLISSNVNYVVGQDQHLWGGATQTSFANEDIKWENSKTFNVGTDWGLFGDKVFLTADYFIRTNTDILLQVPIPLSTGANAIPPYINAGQISNKGIEAALTYNGAVNDFTYQLTGTFTSVKNEVDFLGTGTQQIFGGTPTHTGGSATVTQAGLPVGAFYLIKTDGIFNDQTEIDAHNKDGQLIQPAAKPGDIRFVDANADGKIDQNDRQNLGSPTPKFTYGFGGNARWKGFDVNLFFQGTYGNKIYNGLRQDLEGMNININYSTATLNAWTPERPTDFPRAVINDPNLNSQTSGRFLEDGSYLRFRTLQLGYTLPAAALSALKISNCRFYVSFDNLFTISPYKGFNPDLGRTGSVLDRGVDFGHVAYPLARTSMAGLQLSF